MADEQATIDLFAEVGRLLEGHEFETVVNALANHVARIAYNTEDPEVFLDMFEDIIVESIHQNAMANTPKTALEIVDVN